MISGFISRFFGKATMPAISEELWQATLAQLPFLARL
ncbi:MAG: hypothetical protein QG616_1525, partial [Pseudomonadota bacterium]|nr:hypothetical protein [Pseudomonadota bacterium]